MDFDDDVAEIPNPFDSKIDFWKVLREKDLYNQFKYSAPQT